MMPLIKDLERVRTGSKLTLKQNVRKKIHLMQTSILIHYNLKGNKMSVVPKLEDSPNQLTFNVHSHESEEECWSIHGDIM